jgi:hypothetical protein
MLVRLDFTCPARSRVEAAAAWSIQSIPPLSPLGAGTLDIGTGTGADRGVGSARVGATGVPPPLVGFTYNQLFTFPNGS